MTLLQRSRTLQLLLLSFGVSIAACAQPGGVSSTVEPGHAVEVPGQVHAESQAPARASASKPRAKTAPVELFEVTKVVDGDTISVMRNGRVEKLRLLSVDTEEQLSTGSSGLSSTKPPTIFGEECALWARSYFAGLATDGKNPRVGLAFPNGVERYDAFGRLLCGVILPDGTNYQLMLVEMGKSPYFDKYGYDETDHEAFVAAQKSAQSKKIGIWDPKTNMPTTPGVPAAKRPYDKLLPWWDARGEAVEAFRKASARADAKVCDAEDPDALAKAVQSGEVMQCFGEIGRVTDEKDGAVLVHFRATAKDKALVVRVSPEILAQKWPFDLRDSAHEFHQNYVWLEARVTSGPGASFRATFEGPKSWRLAGPEPKIP